MKTRFNTYDIVCVVAELQKCIGMRVNNVYDINTKTYLIRLQRSEEKQVILLESGNRIHLTNFEWPKNIAPSGFSMKLRKHLRNKRLESLTQLGTDRIIDLQFGTGEAAYHIILELYDRGNIIITDHTFTILNVLRPHTEGDKVKFAVREIYPQDRARESAGVNVEELREVLERAKVGDQLKKVLVPNLEYGPALIEHVLLRKGFNNSTKLGKTFDIDKDMVKLIEAIKEADEIFKNVKDKHAKGYIIQKAEERPGNDLFYTNQEFHPMLFEQHLDAPHKEFPTFNEAIDEFFSSLESQKLEVKAVQQEREAMKKLENVRKDHTQRLEVLELTQNVDKQKADLILRNQELVDGAILAVQTILAKQVSWDVVNDIVKSVSATGDPVFSIIKKLKLETNHISLHLTDPYANSSDHHEDSANEDDDCIPAMMVDIDLGLSAFANARKYFDQKRSAAKKQQKTIESHTKALKSAEKKTKQVLKEVQVITNIIKARKTYWFEKFFWFISSENYLVIGGRDQQQNELIVKRYMKGTDVYVHADVHGASSIVIKNPTCQPVPPKTLNEAGTMAICYSVAWEAKVVTNAYWVWGDQVSKTAPTGEYLTTGSFMVRGKKNFLPPSHLVLGLGFLFRLEDSSVERHKGERKVLNNDVEEEMREDDIKDELEVEILDESDEDEDDKNPDEKPNDEKKSSDSEDDEGTPKFPDTHIKIQHFSGMKINILTELPEEPSSTNVDMKEEVVYLGDNKPIVVKPMESNSRSRGNSESKNKKQKEQVEFREDVKQQQQQVKRGQKSKLKKIKEKYKDQDEEERKLRMEILQSSGGPKTSKKSKKNKEQTKKIILPKVPKIPSNTKDQMGDEDDEGETIVQADVDMVDALTGIPTGEDELLFAVPVVAPYNTLSNYKFKMKLTPGTGRRGKAARTAVTMFLRDRTITQREKDLLKAVKDEQLARNIPGKVKLSAPKLQNVKK